MSSIADRPRVVAIADMDDFWSIILPVPEVEDLVDPFRRDGDWSRDHGVPAHLTLAGPWPATVRAPVGVLSDLATALRGTTHSFDSVGRLGDALCLFVAGEEALLGWRRSALEAVGTYDRISPSWRIHLTVSRQPLGARGDGAAERAIESALPIAWTAGAPLLACMSGSTTVTMQEL